MHGPFVIFGIEFPAYFTLLMIGYMLAVYLAVRVGAKNGVNPTKIVDLAIVMLIGGVLGCRIAHVLFDGQLMNYYYWCVDPLRSTGEFLGSSTSCATDAQCVDASLGDLCHPIQGTCHRGQDCWLALKFWYGGLTFYGGLLLCIPLGIWFMRLKNLPVWKVTDLCAFAIPLGLGFGRLGCWFSGCCFGDLSDHALGVSFPNGSMAWLQHYQLNLVGATDSSLPVHPTQLYSAVSNFLIFGFTYWWYRRKRTFDGEVFWLFILLYAVSRFVIELWRADERGALGSISTSQWIGVAMLIISIRMLNKLYKKSLAPTTCDPVESNPSG